MMKFRYTDTRLANSLLWVLACVILSAIVENL
jgi:hypothetical protein